MTVTPHITKKPQHQKIAVQVKPGGVQVIDRSKWCPGIQSTHCVFCAGWWGHSVWFFKSSSRSATSGSRTVCWTPAMWSCRWQKKIPSFLHLSVVNTNIHFTHFSLSGYTLKCRQFCMLFSFSFLNLLRTTWLLQKFAFHFVFFRPR